MHLGDISPFLFYSRSYFKAQLTKPALTLDKTILSYISSRRYVLQPIKTLGRVDKVGMACLILFLFFNHQGLKPFQSINSDEHTSITFMSGFCGSQIFLFILFLQNTQVLNC